MYDTKNEDGLVPSLLVSGAIPRFPFGNSPVPSGKDRMEALCMARQEIETIFVN